MTKKIYKFFPIILLLILAMSCKESVFITKRVHRGGFYTNMGKPKSEVKDQEKTAFHKPAEENEIEPLRSKKPIIEKLLQKNLEQVKLETYHIPDISNIDFNASTQSADLSIFSKQIMTSARILMDQPDTETRSESASEFYIYLGLWITAVVVCFFLYPLAGWILLIISIVLLALLVWMIIAIGKAIKEAGRRAHQGCGRAGRSCSNCG